MASCVVWCRDSTYSQGFYWFKSLLPTFRVRYFLQACPRHKFQKWFHSSEYHILSPCWSEKEKASFLLFNKSKEEFSPETPRKCLLASYWSKVGHVLNFSLRQSLYLGRGGWALQIGWSLSELTPGKESGFTSTGNEAFPQWKSGMLSWKRRKWIQTAKCQVPTAVFKAMTSTTAHSLP